MYTKSILAFSIFSILSAACAQAQEAALQPTVEVTASRVAETVDSSLADVSVITRKQIEASGAPDLIDILRLQAGVDIAQTGGPGQHPSVFLRGTNSNQVLVLIDGVRIASANAGYFQFENLPLESIERIEIVRGPRASYWGSDAVGGVIQIFTRKLDGAQVSARYGSYADAAGSAGYGVQTDQGGFSAQFGGRHVDGFPATNPAAGQYVYNPLDDSFQNHNIVANGNYTIGTQSLSATLFRSVGTVEFANGPGPVGAFTQLDQAIGVNLAGPVTQNWSQRLSVGTSRENLDDPGSFYAFHSTREQASWTNDVTLSTMQHLILGVDYYHDFGIDYDPIGGDVTYDKVRANTGVFAGWRLAAGEFDSEISAREDHDSQFGGAFSGSAALGYKLTDNLRITGSYGTAFDAPSLEDLYYPGFGGQYAGNPDLRPERSRSGELGLEWTIDDSNRFAAHAFTTRIRNLIEGAGVQYREINIGHAAIDGIELTDIWHRAAWTWTNTLTLQNPRDEDTDTQLVRRPKQKFSSVLDTALGEHAHAGIELVYSGRADDIGAVVLGAYTLVNLRADYALGDAWRIGARVDNLADKNYTLVYGYNTPGRAGYLTVTWTPHW